eukprot:scaffold81929_cov27-Tisochrysis_lutea.AAC.2
MEANGDSCARRGTGSTGGLQPKAAVRVAPPICPPPVSRHIPFLEEGRANESMWSSTPSVSWGPRGESLAGLPHNISISPSRNHGVGGIRSHTVTELGQP